MNNKPKGTKTEMNISTFNSRSTETHTLIKENEESDKMSSETLIIIPIC
jgi:hypothetical protein